MSGSVTAVIRNEQSLLTHLYACFVLHQQGKTLREISAQLSLLQARSRPSRILDAIERLQAKAPADG